MRFLRDIFRYLIERKKWWLAPLLFLLLLVGLIIIASTSAIAPFIYSLF
ncbi:MAG: DUF5989 family protein [Bacteroidales bacterium]|nr:DUF5989 family protein [Bacteroidales bacterium]